LIAAVVFAAHVETSAGIMLPNEYIAQLASAAHAVGERGLHRIHLRQPLFIDVAIAIVCITNKSNQNQRDFSSPLAHHSAYSLIKFNPSKSFSNNSSSDAIFVLDCIASGCMWVDMQETNVDILISAPQKGTAFW
jgi:hypothetical protein